MKITTIAKNYHCKAQIVFCIINMKFEQFLKKAIVISKKGGMT